MSGFIPKILIADDDVKNRQILMEVIKEIGEVHIFEALNGECAVSKTMDIKPDIIFMDILMPKVDGFLATKKIKELLPQTVIIIVSLIDNSSIETNIREVGATALLKKPFSKEILKYELLNIIEFIKIKKDIKHDIYLRSAINPFSSEIRVIKTVVNINDTEDMMDFGLWLVERYLSYNETQSLIFTQTLNSLYTIISKSLKEEVFVSIIIEESYHCLFLIFGLSEKLKIDRELYDIKLQLNENIVLENGQIFIKLNIKDIHEPKIEQKSNNKIIKDIDDGERELLRKSFGDKIDAKSYLKMIDFEMNDEIYEMKDLESEFEHILMDLEHDFSTANLHKLSNILSQYSTIINSFYEFNALGYSISMLGTLLYNLKENLDIALKKKCLILLSGICSDLVNWRDSIFINATTNDIHYLDSSLLSSCMQIESILTNTVIEDSQESDLELF